MSEVLLLAHFPLSRFSHALCCSRYQYSTPYIHLLLGVRSPVHLLLLALPLFLVIGTYYSMSSSVLVNQEDIYLPICKASILSVGLFSLARTSLSGLYSRRWYITCGW